MRGVSLVKDTVEIYMQTLSYNEIVVKCDYFSKGHTGEID